MNGGPTMFFQGKYMSTRSVPLVLIKAILGIDLMQLRQLPVPRDLGQNRGCRDGSGDAVPANQTSLGPGEIRDFLIAIH